MIKGIAGTALEDRSDRVSRSSKMAFKAAFDAYKALSGVNKPVRPSDEFLHAHTRECDWNESYYFNFFDPRKGIGGWTRIGFLPNQELDHGLLALYWKDRTFAFFDRKRISVRVGQLALGDLQNVCLEPTRAWKISFSGDLVELGPGEAIGIKGDGQGEKADTAIDLTFEGVSPPFDVRSVDSGVLADLLLESGARMADARLARRVSSRHYEQAGKVTGRIRVGSEEASFDGGGHRDHSWGVRDWTVPNYWNFSTFQFGDEMAYSFSRVSVGNMVLRFGHLIENGNNRAVHEGSMSVEESESCQRTIEMRMADLSGDLTQVLGTVIRSIPVVFETPVGQTVIDEALTEYRWKDQVGLGVFETLSNELPGL